MKLSQTDGLGKVSRYVSLGKVSAKISRYQPLGLFCGVVISKTECIQHQYVTSKHYHHESSNILATVNEEVLKTWREIEYRVDIFKKANGGYVKIHE